MSTLDGFILARSGITMLPEQLKTLSEGELVTSSPSERVFSCSGNIECCLV